MTDDTVKDTSDPLQSDAVVQEAGFAVAEGEAVECLTSAFERYIQNYQDTWQKNWLEGIQTFEQNVESWQTSIAASSTSSPLTSPPSDTAKTAAPNPTPVKAVPEKAVPEKAEPAKTEPPQSGT